MMTFSVILLLLVIVALFEKNLTSFVHNGLVYNGERYNVKKYPYVMYIFIQKDLNSDNYVECTGTLIQKLLVLTAAHCCERVNAENIKVCQGSPDVPDVDYHQVVNISMHPDYNPDDCTKNDICVLKIDKPFPNIKKFSKIGGSPKDFENGKKLKCTIIGFGMTADISRPNTLGWMMTNDVVYGRRACKNPDSPDNQESWEQYLCVVPLGKSKPCQGDSGGPMICNNLQYGVCSYAYPFVGNESSCDYKYTQLVYMFIKYHDKWLNSITGINKKKKKKRSSGNLLKPRHYSVYIVLTVLLCNMLTFI